MEPTPRKRPIASSVVSAMIVAHALACIAPSALSHSGSYIGNDTNYLDLTKLKHRETLFDWLKRLAQELRSE